MRLLAPLAGLLSLSAILPTSFADKKVNKFASLAASARPHKGVIELGDSLYDELTTTPRNYTAVVLLTALDAKFGCQLCKEFQPEYELLAKSWISKHKNSDGLFFGELDFANGKNTFMKVCSPAFGFIAGFGCLHWSILLSCN
jgi:oligosaccharyltransferase complex subunit gamma